MNRYYNLDTLKCIACLMVIYIHTQSIWYILLISKIAVPIFFLISGYFYTPQNFKRQIKKLSIFTCIFLLLYILVHLCIDGKIFLIQLFTLKNFIDFIFINSTTCICEPLWYLPASIYALSILHFFAKRSKTTILFIIIPLLLIINIMLANMGHIARYRNFLFTGLPYITIGYFIAQHKDWIQKTLIRRNLFTILPTLLILLLSEYFLYKNLNLPETRDHYFFITPLSVYIFIEATLLLKQKRVPFMSYIGQHLSGIIYGIHVLFIPVVGITFQHLSSIRFIFVFLISTIIAFFTEKIVNKIKL